MQKLYRVTLTADERDALQAMLRGGTHSTLSLTRARILLQADQADDSGPAWTDAAIAEALTVAPNTVASVRKRFIEGGVDRALYRKTQDSPSRLRKLDGRGEAQLIALACSAPPEGQARWTLRLLANRLVELQVVESISVQTVNETLQKTRSSRGKRSSG